MKKLYLAVAAIAITSSVVNSANADVATAILLCSACHGAAGVSPLPTVPTIAGISALALENAIDAYREGDRRCPSTPGGTASGQMLDMCNPAKSLAEEDIAGVAEHYAALPFVPTTQATDVAKVAQGEALHARECAICHTRDGAEPADDASILAAQPLAYLRLVLAEYAAGTRAQPSPMEARMTPLSADEIEALAQFYASRP